MSFKATIDVGGKSFELIHCESVLEQKSDNQGRPVSGVHGGYIWIVVEGTDDDTFGSWITDPTKKQDGTIIFYRIDQDSKFKEIEFKGAYLTLMIESYISEEDLSDLSRREYIRSTTPEIQQAYDLMNEVQNRTGISYVIVGKLSAEKIKIDGVDHDNKW